MSFSRAQQGKFRPVVDHAWFKHCERTDTAPNNKAAKDKWYRQQLADAGSFTSTKQCNMTADFELVMLPFAIIADDEYWIGRCTSGAERRLKYIIRGFLADLTWLMKAPYDWRYVRATYKQSGMLPDAMDAAPAWQLYKVMQMLDTHIQRICKDYDLHRKEIPALRKRGAKTPVNPDSKRVHIGHDLDRTHTAHQTELPF